MAECLSFIQLVYNYQDTFVAEANNCDKEVKLTRGARQPFDEFMLAAVREAVTERMAMQLLFDSIP